MFQQTLSAPDPAAAITRVVLIEDHELTRVSMRAAIQQQGHIVIAGEASSGLRGLELVTKLQPNVAIVDIGLPDLDGIEITRRIKQERLATKVLILTLRDNEQEVLAAFAAGADSYCMKDISSSTLKTAIQTTHDGHNWIDPAIAGMVLRYTRKTEMQVNGGMVQVQGAKLPTETSPLSERELEVLQLIVEGLSNAEIAERLYITLGTVKTHVRNLLNKLCADDRTQAAVLALRSGLIR
jgi:two-component system, NarL family, response regulator LiaR